MCRFILCFLLCLCTHARASTFIVNSLADSSDDSCTANGGGCTLREAITAANGHANTDLTTPDVIKFNATIFATAQVISLNNALPSLKEDVIITGPTAQVTVQVAGSNQAFKIFAVDADVKVDFTNLLIKYGETGILNSGGTVTITNSTLSGSAYGIDNNAGGSLIATDCKVNSNGYGFKNTGHASKTKMTLCTLDGNVNSAIENDAGKVTVTDCTVSNSAYGISNSGSGVVAVTNCTLDKNSHGIDNEYGSTLTATNCTMTGGEIALFNFGGTVTALNCSLRDNTLYGFFDSYGGILTATNCTQSGSSYGIYVFQGTVTATNCTVVGNTTGIINYSKLIATNCTVSGNENGIISNSSTSNDTTASLKNTLIVSNATNTQGTAIIAEHSIIGGTAAEAGLEVDGAGKPILKDNGGSTKTIALISHGTAINAGNNALLPVSITTDQRGSGFPRIKGGIVDIGAFESAFPGSSLSVGDTIAITEGSASTPGSATFSVKLSAPLMQAVTVNFATADGATNGAKAGSDYIVKSGTLTFASGETVKFVKVTFVGDAVAELNEPFFLDIKTPTNATIADSRGSTYIKNDDGPGLSIANAVTVNEGNSGTKTQTFTVTLSAASTDTVTVNYTTANGTAGPADYTVQSGILTFVPGETSKVIMVLVKGDTTVETTETYKVNLVSPKYAILTDSQGSAYIRNDDVSTLVSGNEMPSE